MLILNYHRISISSSPDIFCIKPHTLKAHFQLIHELCVPVIQLNTHEHSRSTEAFSIGLTFDDGNQSDYDIVLPLLEEFNFPATFFPYVNNIGSLGGLSWSQLLQIKEKRFLIGSHGLSHKAFPRLSNVELNRELIDSKKILEDKTGGAIHHLASPYGAYNNTVLKCAEKAGYKKIYSTGLKVNDDIELLRFRWNITQHVSLKKFRSILMCDGKLPYNIRLSSGLKHFSKKLLGTRYSQYLNELR